METGGKMSKEAKGRGELITTNIKIVTMQL